MVRRRRRHERGALVLTSAFLVSLAGHLLVGFPLRDFTNEFLSSGKGPAEVKVVKISADQWAKNAALPGQQLRDDGRTRLAEARVAPALRREAEVLREAPKPPQEKEKKKVEDKLTGQVVEVPPTADDSPNPDAKYLSKYNTRVEKETTARPDARDPSRGRVTNKLQSRDQPGAPENAIITPGLTVKGDGLDSDKPGDAGAKEAPGDRKFVLEVPDLKRRDAVELKRSELPGVRQAIANRIGSESMKGNSNRFRLEMGSGADADGKEKGGKKGEKDGADSKSIPTLAALLPNLGTVSRISGSPSRDYVEGVPEGDGTFLNTKEFKYATFFYRVRDSVASYWEDLVPREYRRRDPTGNIYGTRDRSTLLNIRLTKEGRLEAVRVEQTSGVDFLDNVAVQAFNMAEPFPNPPPGIADDDGVIRFNFQFVVTMRSRGPFDLFR